MAKVEYVQVKGVLLKLTIWTRTDGSRQINVLCRDKYCPHKCATCIMMPAGLWSVSPVQIAEKCCLHCKRLEKMATETAKRDGRISLTSLVKSEVK